MIWNVDGGIVLNGQGQYNAIYNNTVAIDNATIPSGASLIVYSPVSPPSQSSTLISNNIFQPSATLTLSPFETSINSIGQNYQIDASQEAGNPAGFVAWCQQLPGPPTLPVLGPGYNDSARSHPTPHDHHLLVFPRRRLRRRHVVGSITRLN